MNVSTPSWQDMLDDISKVWERLSLVSPSRLLSPKTLTHQKYTSPECVRNMERSFCCACEANQVVSRDNICECFYCGREVCDVCMVECQQCIDIIVCQDCRARCPIPYSRCGFMICHKHSDNVCSECNEVKENDMIMTCSKCRARYCDQCCVGDDEYILCWDCVEHQDDVQKVLVFV